MREGQKNIIYTDINADRQTQKQRGKNGINEENRFEDQQV